MKTFDVIRVKAPGFNDNVASKAFSGIKERLSRFSRSPQRGLPVKLARTVLLSTEVMAENVSKITTKSQILISNKTSIIGL